MADYSLPDLPYDYAALGAPRVGADHGAPPRQAPRRLRDRRQPDAREAGRRPRQGRLRRHRRAGEDAGLPRLGPRPALHLLEEPEPRRRRQARRRAGLGHRRELRLLRQVQGALHPGHVHHPGLGLGRARLRAPRRPAHRRAGLRPPGQRRPGLGPAARLRRLGARLLPAVQEREGRLLRRPVERRQLARRGGPPRRGQGRSRSPAEPGQAARRPGATRATGAARTCGGSGRPRGRHRGSARRRSRTIRRCPSLRRCSARSTPSRTAADRASSAS